MSKKKFDINKMASQARKAVARKRTTSASKDNRVKVGGGRDTTKGRGFQGVAGPQGSIAKRLAERSVETELEFDERARTDSPAEGATSGGSLLEMARSEHAVRYNLDGRRIDVGDLFEVYTNASSGWLRGRFEWSGRAKDRPKIGLNLWNPNGPFTDGKAPWTGDLMASLPESAVCRWVEE